MENVSNGSESLESSGSEVEGQELNESGEQSSGESNIQGAEAAVDELQDKLAEAVEDGASDKEIKQMIKEFELKVNGKTIKRSIDLSNEDQIKRKMQEAEAFGEVSKEYATVRNQLNAKIAAWKNDPEMALRDLGIDPLDYAEKRIAKEVEELKKDPLQKEMEEKDRKIAEYMAKEKADKERAEAAEIEKKDQEALAFLKQEIYDALAKHPYIKPTEMSERRVADMMAHYSVKFPEITAEQVLPHVEAEMKAEFNALIESLPEEYVEKFLGKNAIEKLSKKFTKPAPPIKKAPPVTVNQVKTATSQGVKAAAKAENAPKKSFEDIMAGR